MAKPKEQLLIVCSTPDGKKGATPFSRTLPNGKTETFWVELNKPVDVTDRPWVYEIYLTSYWNKNKEKNYSEQKIEEHQLNNGGGRGSLEGSYEN